MGRASHALKQVLERFSISQNKLAVTLGIDRSAVFKWFHEQREPTSETIVEITVALKQLNPEAAQNFVYLYLGELLEREAVSESEASSGSEASLESEASSGSEAVSGSGASSEAGNSPAGIVDSNEGGNVGAEETTLDPKSGKVGESSDGMVE